MKNKTIYLAARLAVTKWKHDNSHPTIQRTDRVTTKPRHRRRTTCSSSYETCVFSSLIFDICASTCEHKRVNINAMKNTMFNNKRLFVVLFLRLLVPPIHPKISVTTFLSRSKHKLPVKHDDIPMKKYCA